MKCHLTGQLRQAGGVKICDKISPELRQYTIQLFGEVDSVDPTWVEFTDFSTRKYLKHYLRNTETKQVKCRFCNKVSVYNSKRMEEHFFDKPINVKPCQNVPLMIRRSIMLDRKADVNSPTHRVNKAIQDYMESLPNPTEVYQDADFQKFVMDLVSLPKITQYVFSNDPPAQPKGN
jgi:hypothetical protein